MPVAISEVGFSHGNLKGESALVAIVLSCMAGSYCSFDFFVAKHAKQFIQHMLPVLRGLKLRMHLGHYTVMII